ncbi:unnamed protein product [Schistosoma mattheei]|uniref:Uncharacterized protein n=1 Tax=Schistosoma mattheei TaxID=31246 RepID=A0A3P8GC94_9TREM|nr:unnamed protein product [Schistosoma mattheei]
MYDGGKLFEIDVIVDGFDCNSLVRIEFSVKRLLTCDIILVRRRALNAFNDSNDEVTGELFSFSIIHVDVEGIELDDTKVPVNGVDVFTLN